MIAALAASFLLSNLRDTRLWVLLALGPAVLAIADRRTAPASTRGP